MSARESSRQRRDLGVGAVLELTSLAEPWESTFTEPNRPRRHIEVCSRLIGSLAGTGALWQHRQAQQHCQAAAAQGMALFGYPDHELHNPRHTWLLQTPSAVSGQRFEEQSGPYQGSTHSHMPQLP